MEGQAQMHYLQENAPTGKNRSKLSSGRSKSKGRSKSLKSL
jgi:hypothetical protein